MAHVLSKCWNHVINVNISSAEAHENDMIAWKVRTNAYPYIYIFHALMAIALAASDHFKLMIYEKRTHSSVRFVPGDPILYLHLRLHGWNSSDFQLICALCFENIINSTWAYWNLKHNTRNPKVKTQIIFSLQF